MAPQWEQLLPRILLVGSLPWCSNIDQCPKKITQSWSIPYTSTMDHRNNHWELFVIIPFSYSHPFPTFSTSKTLVHKTLGCFGARCVWMTHEVAPADPTSFQSLPPGFGWSQYPPGHLWKIYISMVFQFSKPKKRSHSGGVSSYSNLWQAQLARSGQFLRLSRRSKPTESLSFGWFTVWFWLIYGWFLVDLWSKLFFGPKKKSEKVRLTTPLMGFDMFFWS